jgi:hypothetical protein
VGRPSARNADLRKERGERCCPSMKKVKGIHGVDGGCYASFVHYKTKKRVYPVNAKAIFIPFKRKK